MFSQPLIHDPQVMIGMWLLSARVRKKDQVHRNMMLPQPH